MNGNTIKMLNHMHANHHAEFTCVKENEKREADEKTVNTEPKLIYDDGSELEMEQTDNIGAMNDTDIASAVNGLLAARGEIIEGQNLQGSMDSNPSSTRKRSSIWMHFEHLAHERCALCLLCNEKIHHRSSTSNLHRHVSNKHPEVFASQGRIITSRPVKPVQRRKAGLRTLSKKIVVNERFPEAFGMIGAFEGEMRLLEKERELTDALRSAQKQEARALEQQRELLEVIRKANARELAAERESIEGLRRAQEQEAVVLSKQREELQTERDRLQREREELQRLRTS